jgi:hypothetical protein
MNIAHQKTLRRLNKAIIVASACKAQYAKVGDKEEFALWTFKLHEAYEKRNEFERKIGVRS